eukprot:2315367-Pyramimonas_sp.AAC.2
MRGRFTRKLINQWLLSPTSLTALNTYKTTEEHGTYLSIRRQSSLCFLVNSSSSVPSNLLYKWSPGFEPFFENKGMVLPPFVRSQAYKWYPKMTRGIKRALIVDTIDTLCSIHPPGRSKRFAT